MRVAKNEFKATFSQFGNRSGRFVQSDRFEPWSAALLSTITIIERTHTIFYVHFFVQDLRTETSSHTQQFALLFCKWPAKFVYIETGIEESSAIMSDGSPTEVTLQLVSDQPAAISVQLVQPLRRARNFCARVVVLGEARWVELSQFFSSLAGRKAASASWPLEQCTSRCSIVYNRGLQPAGLQGGITRPPARCQISPLGTFYLNVDLHPTDLTCGPRCVCFIQLGPLPQKVADPWSTTDILSTSYKWVMSQLIWRHVLHVKINFAAVGLYVGVHQCANSEYTFVGRLPTVFFLVPCPT